MQATKIERIEAHFIEPKSIECVYCGRKVVGAKTGTVGSRKGYVAHFVCHVDF